MNTQIRETPKGLQKFQDPHVTADGQTRASVPLLGATTLWFNTGTLCNIECTNCYILSSPQNDALVYITAAEVRDFLDQIEDRKWPVREIGFTGGEPFMNPEMIEMAGDCLARGYEVLILTNAMRPMMRPRIKQGLLTLQETYGDKLTLRISIDHYREDLHDSVRGKNSFKVALQGMHWLRDNGFRMACAGRTLWNEPDAQARAGYAAFFAENDFNIDAQRPDMCVLFPEIDEEVEVPEITTACWDILGKTPADIMCSASRMVVKRKGAAQPTVLACTLLAYDAAFELGQTLAEAERSVQLNHKHCAKFCVLGGASCSA